MTLSPTAMTERPAEQGWTACRSMLFIAGGSAALWTLIVYGLSHLF